MFNLPLEEVQACIQMPPPFVDPGPDTQASLAHDYETTDRCGLAIICKLCRKRIGNSDHRGHYRWWPPGGMK